MNNSRDLKCNSETIIYVLIQKRRDIDLDLFANYWKNVHGPVCARLPGLDSYYQFHLQNKENSLLVKNGKEHDLSEEDYFNGIAELGFLSMENCQDWINASNEVLQNDEKNFAHKAIIYIVKNGNSKIYTNCSKTIKVDKSSEMNKLHVLIKKMDNIAIEDFRKYILDVFCTELINSDLATKLKIYLLEEPDNTSDNNVLNKQYQVALEVVCDDHTAFKNILISQEYIKEFIISPEQNTYTFIKDSQVTLSGQRTPVVAELIDKLQANNQTKSKITDLMFTRY